MKKLLALLLALVMVVSLMACASDTAKDTSSDTSTPNMAIGPENRRLTGLMPVRTVTTSISPTPPKLGRRVESQLIWGCCPICGAASISSSSWGSCRIRRGERVKIGYSRLVPPFCVFFAVFFFPAVHSALDSLERTLPLAPYTNSFSPSKIRS